VVDVIYWYLRVLFISLFARGGLSLWLTKPAWGAYWRQREYKADQYAAKLGQADELADFLEIHALIHDHPVPFMWLTEHTHPPTELRIDKLRNTTNDQQAPTATAEALPSTAPDTRPLTT
jgi:Zn-dependent protease with chaperone function